MSTTDHYPRISWGEKIEIVLLGFASSLIITGGFIGLLSWVGPYLKAPRK